MAKYSKAAQKNVESAMKRMEKGTLRSGRSGKKVTNPKQAIAIGLSEAREKGAKVPKKKPATKTAAKKATKKAAPKKSATTKTAAKKSVLSKKKVSTKKSVSKKISPEKKTDTQKNKQDIVPTQELNINLPPVEEKSSEIKPALELNATDPIMATDKKALAKALTKHDPKHQMALSNAKHSIRPSGKKPLWR